MNQNRFPKKTTLEVQTDAVRFEEKNKFFSRITEILMTVYVLFILCVFPAAIHDMYFDILMFRYNLFWKITFAYLIIFALLGIYYLTINRKYIREKLRDPKIIVKKLWESISSTDKVFFLLIIEMGISTIFAPYVYEAFWGNRGRHQGFFLWIFFYIEYILTTKFYKPKNWHIYLILLSSLFPCIWGIMNFFMLNPFGFLTNVPVGDTYIFASTVGNINTYSNYTGMVLAVSVASFILTDDKKLTTVSGTVMIVDSFAHIMSVSDNNILSAIAIFSMLPFIAWKNDKKFIKYLFSVLIFLIALLFTCFFYQICDETMNREGESTLIELGQTNIVQAVTFILAILILAILLIKSKKTKHDNTDLLDTKRYAVLRRIWTGLLIIAFGFIVIILVLTNVGVQLPFFGKFNRILVLNDDWGTGRGLSWRLGLQYYCTDSTIMQKLFGNGPDTYFIIMMDRFRPIMNAAGYGMFDSAHNEYMEYLTTIGIVGLLLYIGLLAKSIQSGSKKTNILCLASTIAVFAYAIQASVNIAIPITSPIFMMYLAICSLKNS